VLPVYQQVFEKLKGAKYERKCPNLIVDGECYEFENYKPSLRREKISNMLSNGLKQSQSLWGFPDFTGLYGVFQKVYLCGGR
jgi:hypothetical protein